MEQNQLRRAIALHDYGFNVIALAEKEKHPHFGVYRSGNLIPVFESPHSVEEIERAFSDHPQANIGILTSNCTVVDADCPEAVEYIEANFPPTPLVTRTKKGRHYFYASSYIRRIIGKKDGREAFSIRGPGVVNYVVAPGSTHPDGGEYTWERFGDLSIDELPPLNERDIQGLQAIFSNGAAKAPAVAATFTPSQGNLPGFDPNLFHVPGDPAKMHSRNNTLTSDIGHWISEGMTKEQTLEMALGAASNYDPPLEVRETRRTNENVWGTHLRNHPEEEEPTPILAPIKIYDPKSTIEELTAIQLRPPGVLGEFFDWHLNTAKFPNCRLASQTALAFGSVVLGRRYVTSADNWPSLFFLTVGKSTVGKDHGKKTLERALENAGLEVLIGGRGYTSPGAILSALRDKPTHITIIDEFGDYLEACNAKGNSHRKEAMSMLNEIFSVGGGTLRQGIYSTMGLTEKQRSSVEKINVRAPAITMYLMTQPERFYDSLGDGDISNGFLGRMLVMDMEAQRREPVSMRRLSDAPSTISQWAKSARERGILGLEEHLQEIFDMAPEPIEIEITGGAADVHKAFFREQIEHQNRLDSVGLGGVIGRMNEASQKLGGIVACSVNIFSPVITEEVARWCVNYCRYAFLTMANAARKNVGGSEYGKVRQRLLNAIIESGDRGLTRRDINRLFRGTRQKEAREVLQHLQDAGEVAFANIAKQGAGRPREAWVAIAE